MYTHEDIITSIVIYSKVSTPEADEFRPKLGLFHMMDHSLKNNQWYEK